MRRLKKLFKIISTVRKIHKVDTALNVLDSLGVANPSKIQIRLDRCRWNLNDLMLTLRMDLDRIKKES